MNSSSSAPLVSATNVPYMLTEVVMALLSVVGNSLICLAIFNDRRLRTITNYFIASLATADFLVGGVAIPCAILLDLGVEHCSLFSCLLMLCNLMTFSLASIFGLLAVAVERYISILCPFRYRTLVTPRVSVLVIACTWALAAITGLMPFMGWRKPFPPQSNCLFTSLISESYMVYVVFFGCVIPPLLVMLILYARIFLEIRRQIRQIAGVELSRRKKRQRVVVREFRMASSLFLVVFTYVFCWFPIHIVNLVRLFCAECHIPTDLTITAVILSHANSAINPLIYVFRMRTFRRAIEATIPCCCSTATVGSTTASSMAKIGQEQHREGNTWEGHRKGNTQEGHGEGNTREVHREGNTQEDHGEGNTREGHGYGNTQEGHGNGNTRKRGGEGNTWEESREGNTWEEHGEGNTWEVGGNTREGPLPGN